MVISHRLSFRKHFGSSLTYRTSLEQMAEAMLAAALDNIESGLEGTPILLTVAGAEPPRRARATAGNENTAPGYGPSRGNNTPPEHGLSESAPALKKARCLEPQFSLEERENFPRANAVSKQVVQAETVKHNLLHTLAE